jgi:hypothetical protein
MLAIKDVNSNELSIDIPSISSSGTKDFDYVLTKEGTFNLILFSRPVSGIRPTYISLNGTVKQSGFIPNWWVDLKTGVMNAGRGNFKVDSNGNVSVEGTIKAKNLYREIYINNKEETYYYYCTKVPESSDVNSFENPAWDSSESNYIPFNYTEREYYKNNEIDDYWKDRSYYDSNSDSYINYLTKCTGYADFIILPSTSNDASQNEDQVYDIILPDPSDFPNKVIEINDYRYV